MSCISSPTLSPAGCRRWRPAVRGTTPLCSFPSPPWPVPWPDSPYRCGLLRQAETALDVVVVSGLLASGATLACNIVFSYGRHLATGWMMDAYPRYYLPLAAAVPLAALSLVSAIEHPRWRNAAIVFLIANPLIFRVLGGPLG